MTLKDLITTNDWLKVEMALTELYPDQEDEMEDFRAMYLQLTEMEAQESSTEIVLEKFFEEDTDEQGYVEVWGLAKGKDNDHPDERVALEYRPWDEWLGMTISEKTLGEYPQPEIICHCLAEMTFMGFDDSDIRKQFALVKKSMEEFDQMSDDEKQARTRSLEDFLEGWDKQDEEDEEEETR